MKSRLAASVYLFSAGTCRGITRNTVSSRSIVTSSYRHCKINRGFQVRGFESSNRHAHSCAVEDDVFAELGPEASKCHTKPIKLFTEKRDCLVKTHRRPVSSCTRPSPKAIIATMGGVTPTSKPKLDDTKTISDKESPNSILVKNIISKISLSEIVQAISIYGKVSSASFEVAPSGLRNCNIEFEDVGSLRRAISAAKITIGGQEFIVHSLGAVDIITFRIENVHEETTEYAVHSRCKTIGEFVGLARTNKDAVEAFFNVRNDSNHLNILESLNNTVIDGNRWTTNVIASESTISNSSKVSSDGESRHNLGMQILDQMPELKKQLAMKKMHLEDFECLIASIMHIEEDLPQAVGFSSGSK